jgi:hypothetical protein
MTNSPTPSPRAPGARGEKSIDLSAALPRATSAVPRVESPAVANMHSM